jgi:hypothetical protein
MAKRNHTAAWEAEAGLEFQFSPTVLESILRTRIEQLEAVTLPTDSHRLGVIRAIQAIPSFQRRLSCFLDYLIDYGANLSIELDRAQEAALDARAQRPPSPPDCAGSAASLGARAGPARALRQSRAAPDCEPSPGARSRPARHPRQSCAAPSPLDGEGLARRLEEIEGELVSVRSDIRRKFAGSEY